tara:strand:+ start:134544 stop:135950 length:1407 start_codon:yes stop_codon:yes gene_type:complete
MKKIYTLGLSLLASAALMAQEYYTTEVFTEVTETEGIVYGTGVLASGGTANLELDIYMPNGDNRTDRPLIITAHQGSFIPEYGDKNDQYLVDYATAMAKRGFVVATMNYREGWGFSPLNTAEQNAREILPAAWRAIQDFKTAVRFFKKSIAEGGNIYGISAERIIGSGFGAGAYLPINSQIIDLSEELTIPELQQKNCFLGSCSPNGTPYIDSTDASLLGIYNTDGGHAGYSHRLGLVVNNSGAIPTIKLMDQGINPLVISTHAENDQATPYKTDIVFAAGVFPIIEVAGSYSIHEKLRDLGENQFWLDEARDGYTQPRVDGDTPEDNQYKQGLLTFADQSYMWSVNGEDTYSPEYQEAYTEYMDSVVVFNAFRIEKWLRTYTSITEKTVSVNDFNIYPNPASDVLNLRSFNTLANSIELRDIAGKLVFSETVNQKDQSFDIANLKPGIYLVKIETNQKTLTQKFVKR